MSDKEQLYYVSQVAEIVKVTSQTIKRWAKQKKIPQPMKLKSSGRLVFTGVQVEAIKKFSTDVETL